MGLFSRGNKKNVSLQTRHKSVFAGKKIQDKKEIDFRDYSSEELLHQFKTEAWDKFMDEEKISLLQEIENREAIAHNREPAKVIQTYGSDYGGYSEMSHIIEIRLTDNQFEDLDTLYHESEHANQSRSLSENEHYTADDKKLMLIENTTSSDGRTSHYTKYKESLYNVMTSELDSNNTALERVVAEKEKFLDEKRYQSYLINRQNYFRKCAEEVVEKREMKKDALLETTESAYIRYELTRNELEEIQKIVSDHSNIDSCEKRTLEISEALAKYDLENNEEISKISLDSNLNEQLEPAEKVSAIREEEKTFEGIEILGEEIENVSEDKNEEEQSIIIDDLNSSYTGDREMDAESILFYDMDNDITEISSEESSIMADNMTEIEDRSDLSVSSSLYDYSDGDQNVGQGME